MLSYDICRRIHQLIHIQYLLSFFSSVAGILLGPDDMTETKQARSLLLKIYKCSCCDSTCCLIAQKFVYKNITYQTSFDKDTE